MAEHCNVSRIREGKQEETSITIKIGPEIQSCNEGAEGWRDVKVGMGWRLKIEEARRVYEKVSDPIDGAIRSSD